MSRSQTHGTATAAALPGIEQFEAARIDAGEFSHASHVYVAWLYLQELDLPAALTRYSAALKSLTRKLGVPMKYHETITGFFMILIAERVAEQTAAGKARSWQSFRRRNPDLLADANALLARHYSTERLHSALARRQFVLPDRAPLRSG